MIGARGLDFANCVDEFDAEIGEGNVFADHGPRVFLPRTGEAVDGDGGEMAESLAYEKAEPEPSGKRKRFLDAVLELPWSRWAVA